MCIRDRLAVAVLCGFDLYVARLNDSFLWELLAVFWGMNLAGTALAYLLTMRRTFLETNLGRE